MAQIAEIIMAILGLCNAIPHKTAFAIILGCEGLRFSLDLLLKALKE